MRWLLWNGFLAAAAEAIGFLFVRGHLSLSLCAIGGEFVYLLALCFFLDCLHDGFEATLCKILRTREIHKPEGLYLRRFYLSPRVRWLPFQIFLHHILLDDDRHLHDHPWDFWTFILKGCYREFYRCREFTTAHDFCGDKSCSQTMKRLAPAGTLLFNRAEHTHRVELIKPVWSLVIARRPRRKWGFWEDGVDPIGGKPVAMWTPADKFLNDPHVFDHAEDRL